MSEAALHGLDSIDAMVAALYDAISGPAGGERDWERFRGLFYPGARLLRTVVSPEGVVSLSAMAVQDFIDFAAPFFRANGFYEREIGRRVEQFGHIVQVFSTYAAFSGPDDNGPLGRGINSIQLWSDGERWWVVSMLWDDERPGNPLPPDYLFKAAP